MYSVAPNASYFPARSLRVSHASSASSSSSHALLHLRHERGVLSDGWVGDHLQGSLGVAEVRFESSGGLELVLGVREVGHDRLGGGGVVPQSAVRGARVEIGDGGVEAGDVDDVQSARDGGGEGVDAAAKNADRRVG